jgi:hypothetical protein
MAKCNICKSRKGKRKCISTNALVCSLCCGETRNSEQCTGCSYYKDASEIRKYNKVPHFTIKEMDYDFELQNIAELIEKGICIIDDEHNIDDSIAIRFIELLLDKYYYKDQTVSFNTNLEEKGFSFIHEHLEKNYKDLPADQIYKVLSTVLRSIKRHNNGTRDYLNFAHQFAGA